MKIYFLFTRLILSGILLSLCHCIFIPGNDKNKSIDDHFMPGLIYFSNKFSPIANTDSLTTNFQTLGSINVVANDTDQDGDTLAVTTVTQATNGTVTILNSTHLSYLPNSTFDGSDSFTYTITDGLHTAVGIVNVTVNSFCATYTQTATTPFTGAPTPFTPTPDGTATKPYLICTKAQIDAVASDSTMWNTEYYVVMNDIDMDNAGANNNTIGNIGTSFTGNFNGNNKTISNFRREDPTATMVGFFGSVGSGATIQDVTITTGNYRVVGDSSVGIAIGYSTGAVQTNLHSSGEVIGGANGAAFINTGGLIGNNLSPLSKSTSSASVSAAAGRYYGGLIGLNAANIEDCSTNTNLTSNTGNIYSGGLVGINQGGDISNSVSSGTITINNAAAFYVGGLVGTNYNTIRNSFSTVTMITNNTFYTGGLVGENLGSVLTSSSSAYILSEATSNGGLVSVNSGSISQSYFIGTITSTGSSGAGIAATNSGLVDNSYSKMTLGNGGSLLVGTNSGIITGSFVTSATITPSGQIFGMASTNTGLISDCYVTVDITCTGGNNCAGIVGQNNAGGIISRCFYTGDIVAQNSRAGGVVAIDNGATNIIHSWNLGSIKNTLGGGSRIGGIVGYSSGNINYCYNLGDIGLNNAGAFHSGGIVGTMVTTGSVSNSYSLSSVKHAASGSGGIAGSFSGTGSLTLSYAGGHIRGPAYVGGLTGTIGGGGMSLSFSTGKVTNSAGSYTGGLSGTHGSGFIRESYSIASINSNGVRVGGLVGQTSAPSIIQNSFSTGSVTSTSNEVGGLVGLSQGTINTSYASNHPQGGGVVGGLVGTNTGGIYSGNFWNTTIGGALNDSGDDGNLAGITQSITANMLNEATFNPPWDFVNDWIMTLDSDGNGLPKIRTLYPCTAAYIAGAPTGAGTLDDPIKICNVAQYNSIVADDTKWDKYITLNEDLDFAGASIGVIGNQTTSFSGIFDGRGHTLSNFTINQAGTDNIGLFGHVNGDGNGDRENDGTIQHLSISQATVIGNDNVGTVVGQLDTGKIIYVQVESATVSGNAQVGGLVGNVTMPFMAKDATSGSITNHGALVLRNSVNVTLDASSSNAGGLVGQNYGDIWLSSSGGSINGIDNTGGIVGYNLGVIKNSHSGPASINGTGASSGGAVGNNAGTITNVFSGHAVPGLVGTNSGTINTSYYDSTLATSVSDGGTALTTAQAIAQANFTGWDFDLHWIENGSYPNLLWE